MGKTVACIIARAASTRLPVKVLRLVDQEHSMLDFIIQRTKNVTGVDEVYLCTSDEPVDDIMEDVAFKNDVKIYRGEADEPIERMVSVAKLTGANNLIRITGDDVFTAYEFLGRQIHVLEEQELDYVRVVNAPLGSSAEVMTTRALHRCMDEMDPSVSEYLTLFIFNPDRYKCGVVIPSFGDLSNISLTVDMSEDLIRTKTILAHYEGPDKLSITTEEICEIIGQYDVADAHFEGGNVKLPYGKVVTYQEFLNDMKERQNRSVKIEM